MALCRSFSGTVSPTVLIELLLQLSIKGEPATKLLIDLFPHIPDIVPDMVLVLVAMIGQSLIIEYQIIEPEYLLHILDLVFDLILLALRGVPELLALGQEHNVYDHIGEIMRKVPLAQRPHNPPEHLIALL